MIFAMPLETFYFKSGAMIEDVHTTFILKDPTAASNSTTESRQWTGTRDPSCNRWKKKASMAESILDLKRSIRLGLASALRRIQLFPTHLSNHLTALLLQPVQLHKLPDTITVKPKVQVANRLSTRGKTDFPRI